MNAHGFCPACNRRISVPADKPASCPVCRAPVDPGALPARRERPSPMKRSV